MRGTAGSLIVLATLCGCAVVKNESASQRPMAGPRGVGAGTQTAWKQFNFLNTPSNGGQAVRAPLTVANSVGVSPQSPWPTSKAQVVAGPQPVNTNFDPAAGTLVSATYVETAREPSPAGGNTDVAAPKAVNSGSDIAQAGHAVVSKAIPPAVLPLVPVLQEASAVLPPPEPPVALPIAPPVTSDANLVAAIPPAPASSAPSVRMVNSKRIYLNFELKDVGESGVSGVELWYTQDTRSWKKYEGPVQTKAPYVVDVDGEGLYGFTMVARSGVGFSREVPQSGELPQVWVEVDLTKPAVEVAEVKLNSTPKVQHLVIRWSASDKNLTARPITLSFAEKAEGPWTPIVANLENTGKYEWAIPASVPNRIHVRVEAADLVGHMASAATPGSILIDRARPTVSILTVEPDKKDKQGAAKE